MNKKFFLSLICILFFCFLCVSCLQKTTDQQPTEKNEIDTDQVLLPNNKPITLLNNLKILTKIDFSEVEDKQFEWVIKKGQDLITITINGHGYQAQAVTARQQSLLIPFFSIDNFEMDPYNLAAGTISGLTGYKKDNLVCLVRGQADLDEQGSPVENKKITMFVSCGEIDESLDQTVEVSKKEIIAKLFADKYNKKISAITITIQQETGGHARGLVKYEDEPEPGNSGMFLTSNINGEWQLLFDGNGSFACRDMQAYGFPVSMLEGCF